MRLEAGQPGSEKVDKVIFNGEVRKDVVLLDTDNAYIIRLMTEEEIERLIIQPGLQYPEDRAPTIKVYGTVEVIMLPDVE